VPKDVKDGLGSFLNLVRGFNDEYTSVSRRTRLTNAEKDSLIREQRNECSISGAKIFVGDDIHIDHDIPLAAGGSDDISNLRVSHSDANLRKGSKKVRE